MPRFSLPFSEGDGCSVRAGLLGAPVGRFVEENSTEQRHGTASSIPSRASTPGTAAGWALGSASSALTFSIRLDLSDRLALELQRETLSAGRT